MCGIVENVRKPPILIPFHTFFGVLLHLNQRVSKIVYKANRARITLPVYFAFDLRENKKISRRETRKFKSA